MKQTERSIDMTGVELLNLKYYLQSQILSTAMINREVRASDVSEVFVQLANEDIPRFIDEYAEKLEEAGGLK